MAKVTFKKGSISSLQNYVEHKIKARGFEDESLQERLLILTEEVGELIRECRHVMGMYTKEKDKRIHIGAEISDIINMLFAVAIKLGINVEEEFLRKEEVVDKRNYKRSTKI